MQRIQTKRNVQETPAPNSRRQLASGQRVAGRLVGLGLSLAVACSVTPDSRGPKGRRGTDSTIAARSTAPSALQKELAVLQPARAQAPSDGQKQLAAALDGYYKRAATRRYYMQLDKPLYRPGETMWFRVHEFETANLMTTKGVHGVMAELVSPKGAVVLRKRIKAVGGVATNDFALPATVQGGEYTFRVTSDRGGRAERSVIVSQYQPPRIKKKAEFLRKAYGEGDTVAATVSLARATGEPFAGRDVVALVVVDEVEVARVKFRTDARGNALVKFSLPGRIARGDGLMTVLVNDGGVTESLQKRIPITLKEVALSLYPEGGQLVRDLPGRVYFSAKNALGKAADIEGRVVDTRGTVLARFASLHNGMGRFELTPLAGEEYFVEITKPAGLTQRTPVPKAQDAGCVMQSIDDVDSKRPDLRVAFWCSDKRDVVVSAVLRERDLGQQLISVAPKKPTVASIPVALGSQGAVRITLFDDALAPIAERLIYRGRGADLKVTVTPDRAGYAPRDQVSLKVETRDLAGKPVKADLSVAVVDDTVLSFADDKTANMMSRIYLESEMPGQEIEEPNFYFGKDPKAAAGLDLVLGTQGWRRFEWRQVFAPPAVAATATGVAGGDVALDDDRRLGEFERAPMAPPLPADKPIVIAAVKPQRARQQLRKEAKKKIAQARRPRRARREMGRGARGMVVGEAMGVGEARRKDEDWGGAAKAKGRRNVMAWAPVRVYPAPNYEARYDGPRVDFRETIHWAPSVKTNAKGVAKVRFYLSDAITSFRVVAEGMSRGGLPGRGEALVRSKLPVSLAVKMPLELSRGDKVRLPITLANETDRSYDVNVQSSFGRAFKVVGGVPNKVTLAGGKRRSFFAELEVVGDGKELSDGAARIAIETSNLRDEVSREIRVVPLGFPQEVSAAGTLDESALHSLNLAGAMGGSIEATVTLYPSPLATMVKGTDAMIREPYGCFEQASSANYPNVMILGYLEENDAAEPALVERTMGMLDRGYKKIAGYESPKKGFEWFGGDPGHEALTAYGLMEFADMQKVYGDVNTAMVSRTAAWLKSRRDGKGGFKRNSRALDSFGRASAEVTNGYITYALTEAGQRDLPAELAYQKKIATSTKDAYLMALAVNAMVNLEPGAAGTIHAVKRLVSLQGADGGFHGASQSITRSGGAALEIESTSLAALALMKAGPDYIGPTRKAIGWLNKNRSGRGNFSSTQATVLTMKAMTTYARESRKTTEGGVVTLLVNGKSAGQLTFEKGHRDPLVFDDLASLLRPGKNDIELRLASDIKLPYSVSVSYRTAQPASSPETAVRLSTELTRAKVAMGESVRMKVAVRNIVDKGIPMTIARVGIPGGLTFQTWQLKELKDKKLIDFYETREREVVLYFRSMAPKASKAIDLDLIARVPGTYVSPASRSYLYYTDEFKDWTKPTTITVTR